MRKGLIICSIIIVLTSIFACSKVPGDIIDPDTMENLLIDIHKAEAYMESSKYLSVDKKAQDSIKNIIYKKHNVSKTEFDTSVVWYGENLEEYIDIYDNVILRLQEEDNALLALMNGQKDMYIGMSRSGDTVNIWNINPHYIFEGKLNNNLLTFTIPYDDNFKEDDIFKLKFKIISKDKSPYATQVILALKQNKNITKFVKKSIPQNGWDSLEIKSNGSIRRVMGSFYGPAEPEWKVTHIDSISLERIHTK